MVLSTFVATFAYSAAGLYTVGLSAGNRTEDFPRLAVSGAIVLLFASLAMVVYFADHLAHSIQVDGVGKGEPTLLLALLQLLDNCMVLVLPARTPPGGPRSASKPN